MVRARCSKGAAIRSASALRPGRMAAESAVNATAGIGSSPENQVAHRRSAICCQFERGEITFLPPHPLQGVVRLALEREPDWQRLSHDLAYQRRVEERQLWPLG